MPTAIEELLRAYSPVTMARRAVHDITLGGCPVRAGDKVLMNYPAANRDPRAFPDADRVVLDRTENRRLAFGAGIHPRVPAGRRRRGHVGRRPGARPTLAAGSVLTGALTRSSHPV